MNVKLMRKKIIVSFVLLVLSISLFVFSTFAYFTQMYTESFSGEVGFVDVDINAYFDDGSGGTLPAEEIVVESTNSSTASDVAFVSSSSTITSTTIDLSVFSDGDKIRIQGSGSNDNIFTVSGSPSSNSLVVTGNLTDESAGSSITVDKVRTKPGVYFINVVSDGNSSFFEDFRLIIDVNSNVYTYIRVKIYEQLTLIYTDYQGNVSELSILFDGYMPFNYDLVNWYDNRIYDNYMYYKTPVKRVNATTSLEIGLIPSYFSGQSFNTYSPGYSLQIAFSIEAIQSDNGPENVWNLSTPPWGGSW